MLSQRAQKQQCKLQDMNETPDLKLLQSNKRNDKGEFSHLAKVQDMD